MTMIASGACRITHGPCDSYFPNLGGKSIASIRRCLASIFDIPDDAEAYIGGSVVAPGYKLRAGDAVEFLKSHGRKLIGDLLTRRQLIERWNLTDQQYQQLLDAGLPTILFEDGMVRHPEVAVDEWFRDCRAIASVQPLGDGLRAHDDATHENKAADAPEEFLRIRDVAAILGCSYSEARDRMLDGRIQAIKDGRWLRTRREWVEEYVAKKIVQPRPTTPDDPIVRVRKPRKGQVVFRKGGLGYQFLKERQQNQQ
jgi:hypothetical protein